MDTNSNGNKMFKARDRWRPGDIFDHTQLTHTDGRLRIMKNELASKTKRIAEINPDSAKMKPEIKLFWLVCIYGVLAFDLHQEHEENEKPEISTRGRRDVIEEEKYYSIRSEGHQDINRSPWLPGVGSEDPTTKISLTNDQEVGLYQTTEPVTDKPTGRGARASNENWIKLPFPNRETHRDILTPPQPSGELINSRMPRVNFVTQNKVLEASESRNDKSIQRPTRTDDLRTEFVRPEEDNKPVFPRQAVYYPEDNRYYDDRYYGTDDLYRRDRYDSYYRRYNPGYGPRVDRYDEYDNYVPRKPKRIIYYAHLPDVIRTPPSVDLRYRYSTDPYRRLDEDYYARGRYDKYRNRYPNSPVRKDDRRFGYRDLAGASTVAKEKKDEKVTPTPVLPQKEDKFKTNTNNNRNPNRNVINSHQYHDAGSNYNDITHKSIQDQNRSSDSYIRFEEPLFHSSIEDPYQRKY